MAENTPGAPIRQDDDELFHNFLKSATKLCDTANELAVYALQLRDSEAFAVALARLALLAQSAIIPSGMVVGTRGLAAFGNFTESNAPRMAERQHIPSAKPGQERVYRTDDIARQMFYDPEPDVPTAEEIAGMSKSALKRLIEERHLDEIDRAAKLPELRKAVTYALHGDA